MQNYKIRGSDNMNKNIPHIKFDANTEYYKKMLKVGKSIIEISSRLVPSNYGTDEDTKNQRAIYLKALEDYRNCKLTFMLAIVPSNLKAKSEGVAEAIQMFITGTQYLIDAIIISESKTRVDMDMIEKGRLLQAQGNQKFLDTTK